MSTGGFDFVAEINERFINRALAAAFYTTTASDPRFGDVKGVEYAIRVVDPPTVDSMSANVIAVRFYLNVRIKKFGFALDFDVKAKASAVPTYQTSTRMLELDLKQATVGEIAIGDKMGWWRIFSWKVRLPRVVLGFFNKILDAVIRFGLLDKYEKIQLSSVLYALDLPAMPEGETNRLTVTLGAIRCLNESVLAACANYLQYQGGNVAQVTDFSAGLDFCAGVSEAGMHRVYDFWWERTTWAKSVTAQDRFDIPVLNDLLSIASIAHKISTSIATLGFVESETSIGPAWIEYGATVTFTGKPTFDVLAGRKIRLTGCPLKIHAWATPKIKITVSEEIDTSGFIPDGWTPWDDDKTISRKVSIVTLPGLSLSLNLNVKGEAEIGLDGEHRLVATVRDLEIHIELGWDLPEVALDHIVNWIIHLAIDRIPPIVLTPAVIMRKIPSSGLTLEAEIAKFETTSSEAFVGAKLSISKICDPVAPYPRFIVSSKVPLMTTAPQFMLISYAPGTPGVPPVLTTVVHRADCVLVSEIPERNKIGIFVLADALRKGHKPCPDCLPEYQS